MQSTGQLAKYHKAIGQVELELIRQEKLRDEGKFTHTAYDFANDYCEALALSVLGEEFGEACRAVNDWKQSPDDITPRQLREELIQVAAVAISFASGL